MLEHQISSSIWFLLVHLSAFLWQYSLQNSSSLWSTKDWLTHARMHAPHTHTHTHKCMCAVLKKLRIMIKKSKGKHTASTYCHVKLLQKQINCIYQELLFCLLKIFVTIFFFSTVIAAFQPKQSYINHVTYKKTWILNHTTRTANLIKYMADTCSYFQPTYCNNITLHRTK